MLDLLPLPPALNPFAPTAGKEPLPRAQPGALSIEIVRQFNAFGGQAAEYTESGIPYLVNEFRTARLRNVSTTLIHPG